MASVIVNIIGNNSSLNRALREAQRDLGNLNRAANLGVAAIAGVGVAFAAMGAAGVAAGAVAAASTIAMTAAIGGALIYFAAKNQEVKDSFTSLKDHVSSTMQDLTAPLVEPLKQFAEQAKGAFDALTPSIANIVTNLAPLITQIGDKLTPIAEKLGPMLESAFGAGTGPLLAFVEGLNPLVEGFKTFFDILNNPVVSEFVTTLMTSLGELLPIIADLLVQLTPLGTVALPIIVTALGGFADILSTTIIPAMESFGTFLSDNAGLVEGLVAALVAFKVIMLAVNVIMLVTNGLMAAARIATMAWSVVQGILNVIMGLNPIVLIVLAIAALIAIIVLLIMNWETVKEVLGKVWDWIKEKAETVWNAVKDFFVGLWTSIKDKAVEIFTTVKDWIVNKFNEIKDKISTIWNNIKDYLWNAWVNIVRTVMEKVIEVKDTVVRKFDEIVEFIKGLPSKMLQMGKDLIQGMINGVKDMAGKLLSSAKDVVQGAIDGAKDLLGINSPSKVFRQFGIWTGQGFIIGIEREAKDVAKAGESIGIAAIKAIDTNPAFGMGKSLGQSLAEGINSTRSLVDNASGSLMGRASLKFDAANKRVTFDAAVTNGNNSAGAIINIDVQAGISSPEETGREVIKAIKEFEKVSGVRWRE